MKAQLKQKLLVPINIMLFICFVIQMSTALAFVLGFAGSLSYFLHMNVGFLMGLLVICHVYLNWSWIAVKLFKAS